MGVIEQILDTAQAKGKISQAERERCGNFLQHIKRVAIPSEKVYEMKRGLPKSKPSPLQARFNAAKTDSWQLEHLLGDFWETMFCDKVSDIGLYSRLLQRYKVYGRAHVSRNVGLPGRERDDIPLPDVAIYQLGEGLIAHVDVKHKTPRMYYPDIGIDFYDERVRLFGSSSLYYAVHSYLTFDFVQWKEQGFSEWREYWTRHSEEYKNADKWGVNNSDEDWIAVRITPDMKGHSYIKLEQFKPLKEILMEFKECPKKA